MRLLLAAYSSGVSLFTALVLDCLQLWRSGRGRWGRRLAAVSLVTAPAAGFPAPASQQLAGTPDVWTRPLPAVLSHPPFHPFHPHAAPPVNPLLQVLCYAAVRRPPGQPCGS